MGNIVCCYKTRDKCCRCRVLLGKNSVRYCTLCTLIRKEETDDKRWLDKNKKVVMYKIS